MARNRFPGKPAKITLPKRQRVISKRFALNKENLVLNENVSRGINCFYSMIGESDEDEDFHGFTEKEIQFANLKSEYLQAQTEQQRQAYWLAKGVALDPEDREEIFKNSGASTASDKEDDFVTEVGPQKLLHIPPTESSDIKEDKAGGEKIKSVEKSKLLVQNLLSDGLCKPKSETTSESSSKKKRKVLKKRVKVAVPKISDFKKFLDSKLKVNNTENSEESKPKDHIKLKSNDSIIVKVKSPSSQNKKSKVTGKKQKTLKSNEGDIKNDKLSPSSEESKVLSVETNQQHPANSKSVETNKRVEIPTPEEFTEKALDVESKVPLLHQNLIVEGKRRWKPSFKVKSKIDAPVNRHHRSLSLDTASETSLNSETEPVLTPQDQEKNNQNAAESEHQKTAQPLGTQGLEKSVQQYANAMSKGKENEDSGDLKQIQKILQSQWKGRLKKTEEKTKPVPENSKHRTNVEPKKILLRESLLTDTANKSTNVIEFYELDDSAVSNLKRLSGLEKFCDQAQKYLRGLASAPELVRDCERKFINPIGCALIEGNKPNASKEGNIICGICGNIRYFENIESAKNYGTFTCESCKSFLSSNTSKRICPKLKCIGKEGTCFLPPQEESYKKKRNNSENKLCRACWLLLCLLGCDFESNVYDKLKNLLPTTLASAFSKPKSIERNSGKTLQCTRKFSLSKPLTEKESHCQNSDASSINSDEILAEVKKSDRRTVVHEKLSNGWAKKAVRRRKGSFAGRWDVYLLTPDNKILRSQHDLKIFIAKSGAVVDSNIINFALPKRTALMENQLMELKVGEEKDTTVEDESSSISNTLKTTKEPNVVLNCSTLGDKDILVPASVPKKSTEQDTMNASKSSYSSKSNDTITTSVRSSKRESKTPSKFADFTSHKSQRTTFKQKDNDSLSAEANSKDTNSTSTLRTQKKVAELPVQSLISNVSKSFEAEKTKASPMVNSHLTAKTISLVENRTNNTAIAHYPRLENQQEKRRSSVESFQRYKCDECEKNFKKKSHLDEHMLIHAGEKPFKCEKCGWSFRRKDKMRKHMETCNYVNRESEFTAFLRPNKRRISGGGTKVVQGIITANPGSSRWQSGIHICEVCQKDCGYKQNLLFHMKKHEKYGETKEEIIREQSDTPIIKRGRGRPRKSIVNESETFDFEKAKLIDEDEQGLSDTIVKATSSRKFIHTGAAEDLNNSELSMEENSNTSFDKFDETISSDVAQNTTKWRGGVPPSYWVWGRYICEVCKKDCGYANNLGLHRKRSHNLSYRQEKLGYNGEIERGTRVRDSQEPLKRKHSKVFERKDASFNLTPDGKRTITKAMPCFECVACKNEDCLDCKWCHDKKKYGGPGKLNKRCIQRRCTQPKIVEMVDHMKSRPIKMLKIEQPNGESTFHHQYLNTPIRTTYLQSGGLVKAMPCRNCSACLMEDCGECKFCLDKRKFGGPGKMNKRCKMKQCLTPKELGAPSTVPSTYIRKQPDFISSKFFSSDDITDPNISFEDDETNHSSRAETPSLPDHKASLETFIEMGLEELEEPNFIKNIEFDEFETSKTIKSGERPKNQMLSNLRTIPISSEKLSPSKCNVGVDYWESYEDKDVQIQGTGVIVSDNMNNKELCFICGSSGESKMLYCASCCEPFHPFCLQEEDLPQSDKAEEGWVCSRCVRCKVCGEPENTVGGEGCGTRRTCVECRDMFHSNCLPLNMRDLKGSKRGWICGSCLRCSGCGTSNVQHYNDDSPLCSSCCQARLKGRYCSICKGCYEEDDFEQAMMECAHCGGWIHAKCEGIDGEQYQVLSYLPDSVEYICKCKDPTPKAKRSVKLDNRIGQETNVLGQVLVPVPVAMTNSPAREYSLQSLNEVPHNFDVDFDSTLQSLNFDVPVNINIPQIIATKTVSNFTASNSESKLDSHEISPKPSEAIDDEYDYVTLDSSVFALPTSIETSIESFVKNDGSFLDI